MPHIPLPRHLPGMLGLMTYRPETAGPLRELTEVLLRGPSPLSPGERELIASYVSTMNQCRFCAHTHGAAAKHLLQLDAEALEKAQQNASDAPITPKLRALLGIADKVRCDGRSVTADDVAEARTQGASDIEIHDTVLIAAAFCMYNRYVDGLGAWSPDQPRAYEAVGKKFAEGGYLQPHGK